VFECTLKEGVESPYEMIRSNNFKSPVKKIIVKLVGFDSVGREEEVEIDWQTVSKDRNQYLLIDIREAYIDMHPNCDIKVDFVTILLSNGQIETDISDKKVVFVCQTGKRAKIIALKYNVLSLKDGLSTFD
jgi:hypothetical protein